MMNHRHPSTEERDQIRTLVDNVGAVEILRVIAQCIAHDHPHIGQGTSIRSDLNAIAKRLNEQVDKSEPEGQWITLDLPGKAQLNRERKTAESFMSATLVDVFIQTDESKFKIDGKGFEMGYMKVIGGAYCDWNDNRLVRCNAGPVINKVKHDIWQDKDGTLILIPSQEGQGK